MSTKLQKILDQEGITKADLSREKGLNSTTVHYLCKDSKYHKDRKDITKLNVINAIKKLGRSKKQYDLKDVFPS